MIETSPLRLFRLRRAEGGTAAARQTKSGRASLDLAGSSDPRRARRIPRGGGGGGEGD